MLNKLESILGIAKKANKVVIGETMIKEISNGKIYFVVIASDCGVNSLKMIKNKCEYYKVEYVIMLTKEKISKAISKGFVSSVGISDLGLANKVKDIIKEGEF